MGRLKFEPAYQLGPMSGGASGPEISESITYRLLDIRVERNRDVDAALLNLFGPSFPLSRPAILLASDVPVFWIRPDQWWARIENRLELQSRLEEALVPFPFALRDITHQFARLTISRSDALALIPAGCSLSIDSPHFPAGSYTRTSIAGVHVLLHRYAEDNSFDLYVDRSLTQFLCEWMIDAHQSGVSLATI